MRVEKFTMNVCLPALMVFALCLYRADAIKCFQCTSLEEGCANLTVNDTQYLVECPSNKTFCRKTVHTILDNDKYVRINRDCAWEVFKERSANCYENDDDFKFEKSCQCFTDGCNSATSTALSMYLLSIPTILAAYKFYMN